MFQKCQKCQSKIGIEMWIFVNLSNSNSRNGEFKKSLKHCSTIIKSLQAKVVASRNKLIIYTGECKERGHDCRCCAGDYRYIFNVSPS